MVGNTEVIPLCNPTLDEQPGAGYLDSSARRNLLQGGCMARPLDLALLSCRHLYLRAPARKPGGGAR